MASKAGRPLAAAEEARITPRLQRDMDGAAQGMGIIVEETKGGAPLAAGKGHGGRAIGADTAEWLMVAA